MSNGQVYYNGAYEEAALLTAPMTVLRVDDGEAVKAPGLIARR